MVEIIRAELARPDNATVFAVLAKEGISPTQTLQVGQGAAGFPNHVDVAFSIHNNTPRKIVIFGAELKGPRSLTVGSSRWCRCLAGGAPTKFLSNVFIVPVGTADRPKQSQHNQR